MPAKGTLISEESRERYRAAARSRGSQLVRLGIVSEEEFNRANSLGLKWCTSCKVFREEVEFTKNQRRCRACAKQRQDVYQEKHKERLNANRSTRYYENHQRELDNQKVRGIRAYGVEPSWYDEQLARQEGKCAICRSEVPGGQGRFHIDHNHACHSEPKTACDKCCRGLLCSTCNVSIARLESDPGWFHRAMDYLKSYGTV